MTKLQKQKEFVINEFGKAMVIDHWGNFKHNAYRIKIKKSLFRFEKKIGTRWLRLQSIYHKDATTDICRQIIKQIFCNPIMI